MRQMNKPRQQKSVVLLDEAPTIYIPNIEQIPATARSNKIATIFGVQDFSQLVDNYGEDKAQIIISNLGNQFFGRVTNGRTAEMVGKLFSKEDRTYINKNIGTGTSGQVIHTQSNQSSPERRKRKLKMCFFRKKGQSKSLRDLVDRMDNRGYIMQISENSKGLNGARIIPKADINMNPSILEKVTKKSFKLSDIDPKLKIKEIALDLAKSIGKDRGMSM